MFANVDNLSSDTVPTIRSVTDTAGAWRRAVDALGHSSLAHSPEWFTVIQRAYGHDPLYLTAEDDDGGVGILPAFVVRRPLAGTVVTSMPFLDGGGPCSSSAALAHLLVARLIAEARRLGANALDIRSSHRLDTTAAPMDSKVNMWLALPGDPGPLWRQLDKGVRNQIRKAERSGLSVDAGGVEHVTAFYDTFAVRMRELGSPVHAPGFLRQVVEEFGDRARVLLVRKDHATIGGLVALAFKDRIVVPWAACRKEYFSLCPNMLLYWEIIRTACTEGFRRFDFGRSTRHSGTYRFKCQWGAREEPMFWYTIPLTRERTPVPTGGTRSAALATAWQRLPLPVTRLLGPRIRKYLIQ
jgi:serine/alanine adding enzyme